VLFYPLLIVSFNCQHCSFLHLSSHHHFVVVVVCFSIGTDHLVEGGKKDATFIASLFDPWVLRLDPLSTRIDCVFFDGASNVQKAGHLLQAKYPRITDKRPFLGQLVLTGCRQRNMQQIGVEMYHQVGRMPTWN